MQDIYRRRGVEGNAWNGMAVGEGKIYGLREVLSNTAVASITP